METNEKTNAKKNAAGLVLTSERAQEIGKLGGRPRKPRPTEVEYETAREKLKPYVDDAVNALVAALNSKDERVALRASIAILDRYYGKPTEAIELSNSDAGTLRFSELFELAQQ